MSSFFFSQSTWNSMVINDTLGLYGFAFCIVLCRACSATDPSILESWIAGLECGPLLTLALAPRPTRVHHQHISPAPPPPSSPSPSPLSLSPQHHDTYLDHCQWLIFCLLLFGLVWYRYIIYLYHTKPNNYMFLFVCHGIVFLFGWGGGGGRICTSLHTIFWWQI